MHCGTQTNLSGQISQDCEFVPVADNSRRITILISRKVVPGAATRAPFLSQFWPGPRPARVVARKQSGWHLGDS